MAHYSITHLTTFHYSHPVAVSHHSAHLKPRSNAGQHCHSFNLEIRPGSSDRIERIDYFGNTTELFSIQSLHERLDVEATSIVRVDRPALDLHQVQLTCDAVRRAIRSTPFSDKDDIRQYVYPTAITPDSEPVMAFGRRFLRTTFPTVRRCWRC